MPDSVESFTNIAEDYSNFSPIVYSFTERVIEIYELICCGVVLIYNLIEYQ